MKLKKTLTALAVGSTLMGSGTAMAASITNLDNTFSPFGGFDWASSGSAWVRDFNLTTASAAGASDSFTLDFMAVARNDGVVDTGGTSFNTPGNNTNYEYTVFASMTEIATCSGLGATTTNTCGLLVLSLVVGSWNIYYDSANASPTAGTGFTDGTLILSGVFQSGYAGTFAASGNAPGGSGSGSNSLVGTVTYTNNTYINPDLLGTDATTTLQYGDLTTGWTRPTSFNGISGYPSADTATQFVFQADSNQDFTAVPEPGTVALLGMALLGLGAARRRAKNR